MTDSPDDEFDLFVAAYQIPDEAERQAFLDRAAATDAPLGRRVRALLAAGRPGNSPLDQSPVLPTWAAGETVAGRYELRDRLGRGGMGEVWRAEQTDPVHRPVAVKFVKPGTDSRQVLARFEAERQALALMDHPHIARVLDGGLHAGRPFFVMDYVDGVPFTAYCKSHGLPPAARLALFADVCDALQHAHQKGVIHRDVKPANVLVAAADGRPVVKVIDFGVAKAVAGLLTASTLATGHGDLVGTPQYMSPEQATFDNRDVDTRSDVYALGVLLYELLTGGPPFAGPPWEDKGLLELLRAVREDDPPRPSARTPAGGPAKLWELDWVVLKALEKDRDRRYESAAAFAADVRRFLAGEPVLAHPPSATYRLRKFVRRHRRPVIAAALVFVALLAGVAGTTWGLVKAERAAASERAARERVQKGNKILTDIFDELDSPDAWDAGESLEGVLAARLRTAADELTDDATDGPLATARLRAKLADALARLGHPHDAVPLLEQVGPVLAAHLGPDHVETLDAEAALAHAYTEDGRDAEAGPLLARNHERALAVFGPNHDRTLGAAASLAVHDARNGRPEKALPVQDGLIAALTHRDGPDADATLTIIADQARTHVALGRTADAIAALKRVLAVRTKESGPDHPRALQDAEELAAAYAAAGRPKQAAPLIDRVLAGRTARLGRDHRETLNALEDAAANRAETGDFAAAAKLYEEAETRYRTKLGPRHPHTLEAAIERAKALAAAGQSEQAAGRYEAILPDLQAVGGPAAFDAQQALADLCLKLGRNEQARKLLEGVVAGRTAAAGADAADTLEARRFLAITRGRLGANAEATALHEDSLKLARAKHGPDARITLLLLRDLGISYQNLVRPADAVRTLTEAADRWRATAGPDARDTLSAARFLGWALVEAREYDRAVELLEAVRPRAIRALGPTDPVTIGLTDRLAFAYLELGRPANARRLGREWLAAGGAAASVNALVLLRQAAEASREDGRFDREEDLRRRAVELSQPIGPASATGSDLANLALCLLNQQKWAAAEEAARGALAIREKVAPTAWTTYNSRAQIGAALLGRRRYADAQDFLLQGYRGLKALDEQLPAAGRVRLLDCLDRLAELSDATGRPDEAARWRVERAGYKEPAPPPRTVR